MIRLIRLNRALMVLNSDLIEHIDVTPDTVITLTTGQILRVRESADQVLERIVAFRRRVFLRDQPIPGSTETITTPFLDFADPTAVSVHSDSVHTDSAAPTD